MRNVITAGCFPEANTFKWMTQGHSIPVPPEHWFAFITDKKFKAAGYYFELCHYSLVNVVLCKASEMKMLFLYYNL